MAHLKMDIPSNQEKQIEVESKKCLSCGVIYNAPNINFTKDKYRKDGLCAYCKKCRKLKKAEYYIKNRDIVKKKLKDKKLTDEQKKQKKHRNDKYIKSEKGIIFKINNNIRRKNKRLQKRISKGKEPVDWIKADTKEDALRISRKRYYDKMKSDPYKMFLHNCRCRINNIIKGKAKSFSIKKEIFYTKDQFITNIESKFLSGMDWDNRSLWHIDHIIPISVFDMNNIDDFKKCWALDNLRPIWALDNLRKGSKII